MKRWSGSAAAVAIVVALTGCGLDRGVYDAPLPGGADVGAEPLTVSAQFDDVVDLVPQASVKVDNVPVGRVSKIALAPDGHSAVVDLVVNRSARLPEGTTARLRQSSLLGEKYVSLVRPKTGSGTLRDGAELGLADTSQTAEVEEVLGAMSMLLNGGDLATFRSVSRELQKISQGRPEQIRAFLQEMNTFVTGLDRRKEAITAAIDGMARLARTLDEDKDKITVALEELSPGMAAMERQRAQAVQMLKSLDRLSTVTVRTLHAAQDDMVADFRLLAPIVEQLAKAGNDLPAAMEIMLTYPFPDSVLKAIKGDYFNVFVITNFRTLPAGCAAIGCLWRQPDNGPTTWLTGAAKGSSRMREMWPQGTQPSAPVSPSLLPPTSSPAPGLPGPTVSVPSEPSSPGSQGPSPSAPPSTSSAPTPSPEPSPTTDSPTAPESSTEPEGSQP